MGKKYVCEIDGSIFSNEEELINYIRKKFVKEYEGELTEIAKIYSALKNNFPEWETTVSKGGWHSKYIAHLSNGETMIEQYYGNDRCKANTLYTYYPNPENIEELIRDVTWKIETVSRIVKAIQTIGEFEDVYCIGFEYGYSRDEHRFTFAYKLKEWNDYKEEMYFPWGDNGASDENKFINGFKKYFIKRLEGEVKSKQGGGFCGNYTIDGIDIAGPLSRAKTVRLEILEYK